MDLIIGILTILFVQRTYISEVSNTPQEVINEEPLSTQLPKGADKKTNQTAIYQQGIEGIGTSSEGIQSQICLVFKENCQEALKVARCENSTFNQKAVNYNSDGSRDYSIFQINDIHFSKIPGRTYSDKVAYITDSDNNIRFAYELWKQQGFNPWTCRYVLALK